MKKKLGTILALVLVVAMATVCLVACGPTLKTGVGYAYQDSSVIVATVKTTDGKITSVVINEVEGLNSIGKVANLNDVVIADVDKVTLTSGRNPIVVKKVKIGDKVFEVNEAKTGYAIGGVEEAKWLETEANAKYFVEQVRAGNYSVLKADGTSYEVPYTLEKAKAKAERELTKNERFEKRLNEYWQFNAAVPAMGAGWITNATEMEVYVVANGFVKENVTKVSTGASFNGFDQYVLALELAVNAAK